MKNSAMGVILGFFLMGCIALGQSSPGTVKASWENASRKNAPAAVPAPRKAEPKAGVAPVFPSWDTRRSPLSKPWPYLPPAPSAGDYFAANNQIIDSLQTLYCVSSGYLRSLRMKNEGMFRSGPTGEGRQFRYKEEPPPPGRAKEELAGLYAQLQSLLSNCINGR